MKNFLIGLIIIIGVAFIFGKYLTFNIDYNDNGLPFQKSDFYKKSYCGDEIFLVNVWSIGTMTLLHEDPNFQAFLNKNNLKYITISSSKDIEKLKSLIRNDSIFLKYDITMENLQSIKSIMKEIHFSKDSKSDGFEFDISVTPYYALIKNKKILYTSNNLDLDSIQKILLKTDSYSQPIRINN